MIQLQRRTEVFSEVLNTGLVTSVNVDTTQSDKLLRLLDTVVIKLEGGTDEDLTVLDEKPIENRPLEPLKEAIVPISVATETKSENIASSAKSGDEEDDDVQPVVEAETATPTKSNDAIEVNANSAKRTTSGSSSSSHSSSSSSSSDDDDSHEADEVENR